MSDAYPPVEPAQPAPQPRYGEYAVAPQPPVVEQQWVPAPPPVAPVETPTPYHRLFRTHPNYAWWRPLLAVVLFLAFYLFAATVVSIVWFILAFATGQLDLTTAVTTDALLAQLTDASDPLSMFLLLGSVAVMLPLVPLAMLCAGLRPVSLRHSVVFRIRWTWLLWCLIPSFGITLVSQSLSFLPLAFGETIEPVPVDSSTLVLLVAMILLLVPIQAAAEEYVFRGLIPQTLGAWIKNVWIGMAISTVIFTVGHTQYEIWGMLSVAVMGFGFAFVTWRTGGLEAAIALHVVNNLVAFLTLSTGVLGTTMVSSEGSGPLTLVTQAVFTGGFVLWVEWLSRRRGIARVRE